MVFGKCVVFGNSTDRIDWLLKMGCHLSVRCHFNKQNRINDMRAFEHNWPGSLDVAIMFLAAVHPRVVAKSCNRTEFGQTYGNSRMDTARIYGK